MREGELFQNGGGVGHGFLRSDSVDIKSYNLAGKTVGGKGVTPACAGVQL
jgi:hypothetical protein